MAPKQPCAKYQYVVTSAGPKILPVDEPSCKDEESPADYNAGGYLPVKVNDTFKNGRYRVVRKLGWGHFSTVWLVKDAHTHSHSALKVVKSAGRYAETARDEIKLLSQVQSFSPTHPGRSHIVSFLDSFSHQGPEASHICIVFEPLGENLLALIERNRKKGVPRTLVKVIARQILLGLQYLHNECDLVHTDIKPENILISIPDIESHIHNELSQSPTPTSRRVGVPQPTKSRAGVSIPANQQRTRRQVQIFDSQPLPSPSRSAGKSIGAFPSISSGIVAGSTTQMKSVSTAKSSPPMSSLNRNSITFASGTAASLSSSAPKTNYPPQRNYTFPNKADYISADKRPSAVPPHVQDMNNSLSTSSSSSSIASTVASTAGSSSVTSTPPTSMSYSLGNIMAGFLGNDKQDPQVEIVVVPVDSEKAELEREDLLMIGKKPKGKIASRGDSIVPVSSWSGLLGAPGSWKEKMTSSLSSSCGSSASRSEKTKISKSSLSQDFSASHSPNFWKDPGAAAPAPAVVVSAVAGEDWNANDILKLSKMSIPGSSSSIATVVKPSPSGTSVVEPYPKGIDSSARETDVSPGSESGISSSKAAAPANPSLLTQTAPPRVTIPLESDQKRFDIRPSPPQQISQLSAHMLSRQPHIPNQCPSIPNARSSRANDFSIPNIPIHPTSITPTPTSPTPTAPPPTPTASPKVSNLANGSSNTTAGNLGGHLPPLRKPEPESLPPPISIKIADLGNATPSKVHYTEDIQTRQYRAPEAILCNRNWDARADIWSVACVVFELLTAEFLFDPQGQGEVFSKDDDHMAQIIELLGDFPLEVKMSGKSSRELFDHTGALRYIRSLKFWPLHRVMTEKYLFTDEDATALCEFLLPMLAVDMKERKRASEMLDNKWLNTTKEDDAILEW